MCCFHDIRSCNITPKKIKLSYSINIVIVNFQFRVYNPFINGVIQHVLCFTIFKDNLLTPSQSQI